MHISKKKKKVRALLVYKLLQNIQSSFGTLLFCCIEFLEYVAVTASSWWPRSVAKVSAPAWRAVAQKPGDASKGMTLRAIIFHFLAYFPILTMIDTDLHFWSCEQSSFQIAIFWCQQEYKSNIRIFLKLKNYKNYLNFGKIDL